MFKLKTKNLKLKTLFLAFALLTAALPAWAKAADVDNKSGLRFDDGLDVSNIYDGHRFVTARWRD